MTYMFNEEKDINAFENFVLSHGGIYMQSAKWAKVKLEWKARFYSGFDSGNERVLTALVLERRIPAAGKIWYCPAGAVCAHGNKELVSAFASFMKKELKKHGITALFYDPCVELRINGKKQEFGKEVHDLLMESGFILNTDASNYLYKSPVQFILPLKDENGKLSEPASLLKSFEKGVRYSVRAGENKGLVQKIYTSEDIAENPCVMKDFLAVMKDTSDRNDFLERGAEYCRRLMDVFGKEHIDIMLIYYDKSADASLQSARLKRKAELEKALETAPQKKIKGIKEELESIDRQTVHYEERVRETEDIPENLICVSGGMTLHYNGMSSCLFGGAKNLLRNNLRSSHFFNFRRICRSIELGCSYHDLGYVLLDKTEPSPDGTLGEYRPNKDFIGICAFKKSFGADCIEYIGEYVLVSNKLLYFLYSRLLKKARAVLSVINKTIKKHRREAAEP